MGGFFVLAVCCMGEKNRTNSVGVGVLDDPSPAAAQRVVEGADPYRMVQKVHTPVGRRLPPPYSCVF